MAPLPRWITHSVSFAVGSLVTATTIYLQKERGNSETKQQHLHDDGSNNNNTTTKQQSYIATNRECTVKLPIHIYKPNENMTIVFDTRTKNPVFVIERLSKSKSDIHTSSSSVSSSRNNKRFHEEQTLPSYHRSRNSHYRNSGYDRGHLAPAADFSSTFTSSSPDDDDKDVVDDNEDVVDNKINDTFTLTNISPQLPQFNRLVWLRLEEFVRRVATKEECDSDDKKIETWVVTGPIWLPTSTTTTSVDSDNGRKNNVNYLYTYEGIGQPPSLVSVPTHFFKVVLVVEKKKNQQQQSTSVSINNVLQQTDSSTDEKQQQQFVIKKFGAFVLPHSDHDDSDKTNNKGKRHIRLVDYLVRLTDLEAVTGLDFFPFILGDGAKKDNDILTMNSASSSSSIISKEIADALTDDVRYNNTKSKTKMIESKGDNQHDPNDTTNSSSLVPSTSLSNTDNKVVLSKNRRRKIKEILQKNNKSLIPIEHLCRNNNDCYRLLRVW